MPIGIILITDFWILPAMGLKANYSESVGFRTNWAAVAAWLGASMFCVFLILYLHIEIFFVGIPGMVVACLLYGGASIWMQFRQKQSHTQTT